MNWDQILAFLKGFAPVVEPVLMQLDKNVVQPELQALIEQVSSPDLKLLLQALDGALDSFVAAEIDKIS